LDNNDPQKLVLVAALVALTYGVQRSLRSLAAFHGGQPGQWLDDLEHDFIDNIKNSHTEGISIDNEAKMMDGAINYIRSAVDSARSEIIAEGNGN
jgi:hypothetical protein